MLAVLVENWKAERIHRMVPKNTKMCRKAGPMSMPRRRKNLDRPPSWSASSLDGTVVNPYWYEKSPFGLHIDPFVPFVISNCQIVSSRPI